MRTRQIFKFTLNFCTAATVRRALAAFMAVLCFYMISEPCASGQETDALLLGHMPLSIIAKDLSSDGAPDILALSAGQTWNTSMAGGNPSFFTESGKAQLFLNDSGVFSAQEPIFIQAGHILMDMVAEDLDGDGDPDLALIHFYMLPAIGIITVKLNNGDGTFQDTTDYEFMVASFSPFSLAVGDVDDDDVPDLLAAGGDNVGIFKGNGNGYFQEAVTFNHTAAIFRMALGKMDGDGYPDLVLLTGESSADGSLSILLNNGDGTFGSAADYNVGPDVTDFALENLNSDGYMDVIAAKWSAQQAAVFLNSGDGSLLPEVNYPAGGGAFSVTSGDLDGNGAQDLVIVNASWSPYLGINESGGNAAVLLNNGDGTFQARKTYSAGLTPTSAALVDLDNDGDLDMAITDADDASAYNPLFLLSSIATGKIVLKYNNGDGTFGSAISWGAASVVGMKNLSMAPAANQLLMLILPVGTILFWKIRRKKK